MVRPGIHPARPCDAFQPRQGRQIIAQDQAAEAAVLGKPPPPPISLFSKLCWPGQHNLEKRELFILGL